MTRSEYDRGVNTFSPEGRLFQVEYAIEAIKVSHLIHFLDSCLTEYICLSFQLGSTAIGVCTSEGVVLAVEKRVTSVLMESTATEKIQEIDKHIGCACSGLMADSRTMIDRARIEAQNHWFMFDEKMRVESVTQAVSNLAIQFGDSESGGQAMSRPFGVAILFAGVDVDGPSLYFLDPSGTYVQCDAKAIGSGCEGAQTALQETFHRNITLKEAIKSVLTILKQVMEEKLNSTNVEVATIVPGSGYHYYTKAEVEAALAEITTA